MAKNLFQVSRIAILLLLISEGIYSQNLNLNFEKITLEDGLSHNSVNCFLHSSDGFLWIGTFEGLNIYDGYNIEVFRSDANDSNSLSNNFIECIFEDNQGNIWIGTQYGLNRYNRDKKQFTRYLPDWKSEHSISHNTIKDILQDKKGNLWIATYGGGLNRYDYDKDYFIQFKESNTSEGIQRSFLNCLFEDHENNLWIGTWQKGLIKFDLEKHTFENFDYREENTDFGKANTINTILESDKGLLWLGTWKKGILTFNTKTNKFSTLSIIDKNDSRLNKAVIRSLLQLTTNKILAGTYENGLYIISTNNDGNYEAVNYTYQLANTQSLSNNSIWTLYLDRSGLCWIGTWGGGVNKLDFNKNRFQTFQPNAGIEHWIKHNFISAIIGIGENNYLIGCYDGGFYRFNKNENSFTDLDANHTFSIGKGINSFAKDKRGSIWLGTMNGLYNYNPTSGNLRKFTKDVKGQSLSSEEISTLFVDNENTLWVASWGTGLNRLVPINNSQENFEIKKYEHTTNSNTLSNNTISDIFQDHFGVIWLGTIGGGINKYLPLSDSFQRLDIRDKQSGNELTDISCIYETETGDIWLGTLSEGFGKFDQQNNNFTLYTTQNGLPNNAVYGILEDSYNNLWVSTGYGLCRYSIASGAFHNFFKKDGLHGNIFNVGIYGAHYKGAHNEMLFGGENGLTLFNPADIVDNSYVPEVTIDKLLINGKKIEVGEKVNDRLILNKPIERMGELLLTQHEQVVTFEFASLHFATPQNNQYAYRLEGFETEWNYTTANRRFATYTNLPAGNYTFVVKATNNDGIWNEKSTTSLVIKVTPPFWKTYWFRLMILLALAGIIYLIFRSRLNMVRFQLSVQEKLHEAEQIISEKQIFKLQNSTIDEELDLKNKELANSALYLNQKNERLKVIKNYLTDIIPHASEKVGDQLKDLKKIINEDINKEESWDNFEKSFDVLHDDFMKRFTQTFPKVTHKDLRMVGYMRMNYSNKEIAEMLNISLRSVESSRYRLRKKMDLPSDNNLNDFIIRF